MTDRILVALPDGRWLALDHETFAAVLEAGAELMAPSAPSPPLLANRCWMLTRPRHR